VPAGRIIWKFLIAASIGGSGGEDGKPRHINDAGALVFKALMDDGTEGLYLVSPK